eukprot:scaffold263516_cov33-Prasinocladus_malaysianus.AAC.1
MTNAAKSGEAIADSSRRAPGGVPRLAPPQYGSHSSSSGGRHVEASTPAAPAADCTPGGPRSVDSLPLLSPGQRNDGSKLDGQVASRTKRKRPTAKELEQAGMLEARREANRLAVQRHRKRTAEQAE